MINETLVIRTTEIVKNNPNMDILDALKLAIQEENKFLNELYNNTTESSKNARKVLCKNTYHLSNIF